MNWWDGNNLRLIQNNLREIDADMNVDRELDRLQEFGANTWMINAGGIFAFYPSRLGYQYVTPYLKKDLLREAVDKAHARGIKLIARFDFSKAHESIFAKRPEWFYRSKEGTEVNYYGIVHTCINGYYQQEYSLQMIEEVLTNYEVDGIFFNMFGYTHFDYSGNRYGPCHCDSCQARFRSMYGKELPEKEGDPSYADYQEFKAATTAELLKRVREVVKRLRPEVAISTYFTEGIDIVREESNTALKRPHPVWLYSASENVKAVEDSWDDKLISNCCINAIDLTYRFNAVSKHEVEIRLYESIASGSGLDFCIIGTFEGYPDRDNFDAVRNAFRFHREHERHFGHFRSMADVILVKPDGPGAVGLQEYHGLFKMLKESHILFDVVVQSQLPAKAESLSGKKLLLLPGNVRFNEPQLEALKKLHEQHGAALLATGHALTGDERSRKALGDMFRTEITGSLTDTYAAYVKVDDKKRFASLGDRDWVVVSGTFDFTNPDKDNRKLLPLISPASFGPPERAYGHEISAYYGVSVTPSGAAYMPWEPGTLYYKHGYEDHKRLVTGLIGHLLEEGSSGAANRLQLQTNAPSSVELFFDQVDEGYLLQLLNLSGFNGVTYAEPIPMHEIRITLSGIPIVSAASLKGSTDLSLGRDGEAYILEVSPLQSYEAILIKST
ncbi:family 10 glycosylhydrolase [Paenibacillus cremeus]|uniref:Family 10 glycosylhydrolase n=1 Tax=Paenibacillus cremeus TaxID=2163881 RepID=A0A559KGN2_9BACL|nr:family 10 glycosylhydrolase [Paenibacillus cremeus]TVY11294.1 family 10 glycosylhydrolase [Paenibacillus cremeus]